MCFELCWYRVANLTSYSEFMSESDPVAKNRIEFQWGSKLPGTSSEALTNFSQIHNISQFSSLRLLIILLSNLIVSWLIGAAIVGPPVTEYTQIMGAY